ncbi:hypothetical protein GALMADRAFT_213873 [Galerina marginata CBS 339.88]|uniref:Uncharacterized protein n=1 Tax=Galerina marginata (strain CBS 339.88) TaxID=685588 RepID=A0A067SXV1_GALM3|nr:hypothetical protein GALMADRAFT_213873 [Galerina marginata CBS 339.88]
MMKSKTSMARCLSHFCPKKETTLPISDLWQRDSLGLCRHTKPLEHKLHSLKLADSTTELQGHECASTQATAWDRGDRWRPVVKQRRILQEAISLRKTSRDGMLLKEDFSGHCVAEESGGDIQWVERKRYIGVRLSLEVTLSQGLITFFPRAQKPVPSRWRDANCKTKLVRDSSILNRDSVIIRKLNVVYRRAAQTVTG